MHIFYVTLRIFRSIYRDSCSLKLNFFGVPPCSSDNKISARECRRPRFNPWVRKVPWKRKWQPTPVFLPREFHGQKSLGSYSLWDQRAGHDWVTNTYLLKAKLHTYQRQSPTFDSISPFDVKYRHSLSFFP